MNVLILTGKFGMGHYSVSDALKDEILSKDLDAYVKVIDIIEYLFPSYSKKIYEGFNIFVQYFSFVYNILNKIAGRFGIAPFKDKVIKDIEKLLNYYKADLVITTLPLCAQYVSSFKEVSGSNIPLYTYITDITIHDEWIAKNTDLYFVRKTGYGIFFI